MEQALLETLKGFSTPHLLIVLSAYSISRVIKYLIYSKKAAYKSRVMVLQAEVERLKKELHDAKHGVIKKAD